jgi:hypothetical protein
MAKKKKWIKGTGIRKHRGALHRALGIVPRERIPQRLKVWASHQPGRLGHMGREALTLGKISRRRRLKHKHRKGR